MNTIVIVKIFLEMLITSIEFSPTLMFGFHQTCLLNILQKFRISIHTFQSASNSFLQTIVLCKVKYLSIDRCISTIYICIFVYNLCLYQGNTFYPCPMEYVKLLVKETLYVVIYKFLKIIEILIQISQKLIVDEYTSFIMQIYFINVKNNIIVNKHIVQYPFSILKFNFLTLKSRQEERSLFKMFSAFIFTGQNSILHKINQFLRKAAEKQC